MIGFDPILIDVLLCNDSLKVPTNRSISTMLDMYNKISSEGIIDVPIHVREYYKSDTELLHTKCELQYPIDGIIGIQDGSLTSIKLKDEKAIELLLSDDGRLLTSDNHVLAQSNLHLFDKPGTIVEVRFTKDSRSDTIAIKESFARTDKVKANDMQACMNILRTISDTPDDLARHQAVVWCNKIRKLLHESATKVRDRGRVIFDIGAGDGQSISDYNTDSDITYLLLEPNKVRCRKLYARLQSNGVNTKMYDGAKSSLTALSRVMKGTVKYAILNATLQDVVEHPQFINTLKTCVRCCICSYSISYAPDHINKLASENIYVVGCGYMYDGADERGYIVNQNGVYMKVDKHHGERSTSTVKWGSDKVYSEEAVTTSDFIDTFECTLGSQIIPLVKGSTTTLLSTISKHLYIITNNSNLIE